jgi:hypothetical protein
MSMYSVRSRTKGPDMTEGYAGGTKGKNKRIPLQYFPLQTGTKIQLRMGYTNNPDALFPVFSGIVTELEPGEETITITAQSFLLELMTQLTDCAQTNSWGHLFPAYGGGGIKFTDTAENSTIISKMLKSSNARHFGHWQTRSLRPAATKKLYARTREGPEPHCLLPATSSMTRAMTQPVCRRASCCSLFSVVLLMPSDGGSSRGLPALCRWAGN